MTLIKSISGMRGTIGGKPGENLSPIDIIEFSSAFGMMLRQHKDSPSVVVGRDGRSSGPQVHELVVNTLIMMGCDVIDLGLSTTPTVEMQVLFKKATGGIIITASHNPMEYNALKFLNNQGECINHERGSTLLNIAETRSFIYADINEQGKRTFVTDAVEDHVEAILQLSTIDVNAIINQKFKVVIDCINSTGSIAMPVLLERLGCDCILINHEINGVFAHNPEPLEHNLTDLASAVIKHHAHLGVAIDPDVDRLAFVDEKGKYCGEEYTLVMVADYVLSKTPGTTVSNLSSTKALRDITESRGLKYYSSAVGEVNVVTKMKSVDAIIGGEGNGGIIYPTLHSGRDALVGVALLLSALVSEELQLSEYRSKFPNYVMVKNKIELTPSLDVNTLLNKLAVHFKNEEVDTQDGVKIYKNGGWIHLRKSNTEPILRLYAEGKTKEDADMTIEEITSIVDSLI